MCFMIMRVYYMFEKNELELDSFSFKKPFLVTIEKIYLTKKKNVSWFCFISTDSIKAKVSILHENLE